MIVHQGNVCQAGDLALNGCVRILVVEDQKRTAAFVSKALRAEGWAVDVLHDGAEALVALGERSYDAVVLDIMLPGRDGLSVLRQLRQKGDHTPVILLSARGEVNERVEGLDTGANDYLAKPFALEELIARIRVLLRKGTETVPAILHLGDLSLHVSSRRAERAGRVIELTSREYSLLEYLLRSAGRICTRMMILQQVWEYDFDPGSNIVDVYIRKLRDKVDSGFETKLLHSVRGVGYIMKS